MRPRQAPQPQQPPSPPPPEAGASASGEAAPASLEQLAGEAAQIDNGAAAPVEQGAAPVMPAAPVDRTSPEWEPTSDELKAVQMESQWAAAGFLQLVSKYVEKNTGVVVQLVTPENVTAGVVVVAPVMAKYNVGLPSWLKPYRHELTLGKWVAGVLYQVHETVEASKQAPPKGDAPKGDKLNA